MKTARLLLVFAASLAPAFAQYQYADPHLLHQYNSGQWTSNGTNNASTDMYTSSAAGGGSLIFNTAIPAPSNNYEIRTSLALNGNGGDYITYFRASPNAQLVPGGTSTGTFYAVEITNPTLSNGAYSATLNFIKCVSGSVTTPSTVTIYPSNGMVFRMVFNAGNGLVVFANGIFQTSYYDGNPIPSGQPGVGVAGAPSGNGITAIDIGALYPTAPPAINAQLVGTSVFPNHVDFQFPGVVDESNGPGIAYYQYYRNNNWLTLSAEPELNDTTVSQGTAYSYILEVVDFHGNQADTTIAVTTPPTGAIDPREVGVRTTGTYWGSGGEQLDMRSGNLNFTVPLIKVMSRGGGGAGISLSYNSQNWRQDPGGEWQLGRDIGYGYGWRLQAGSLTPVYSTYWTLDHYLFIDATGAEYILNVNTNGVWSSEQSIYVYYNPADLSLYFTNGSYWVFGCTSAGTEQDAGTMYPSNMYDSNGNKIAISYANGYANGVELPNGLSSSRIYSIEDVRGNDSADYSFNYGFLNSNDPIPHLQSIGNTIGTAEKYTFNYSESQQLTSPFTPATGYGTWTFLANVKNAVPLTTSFTYDSSGSGELDQVTFPYGGHIRWAYGPSLYAGTRTLREVNVGRYLAMSASAAELTYTPWFSGTLPLTFHSNSGLNDADGQSQKAWTFDGTSTHPGFGLASLMENRLNQSGNTTGETAITPTWSLDPAGNPYLSQVSTVMDSGNPTQVTKHTTQTVDQYGNVTQMNVYGYGGNLLRTYTNTYLNTSPYTSLYILNRLLTSTVTDGTYTTTLVTNSYDQTTLEDTTGIYEHSSQYGTSWTTRGNPTTIVSPAGTTLNNYDIAGNVAQSIVNGLGTNNTVSSTTNYAAPSTISVNSLSSTLSYSAALGVTSATGPNGDNLNIVYNSTNRPQTVTSPTGAVTTYTYNDNTTPPTAPNKIATTNGHWVQTNMDGFGRTISTLTGYGTTTVSEVDTKYVSCGCSPIGKMGQQSAPYAPGNAVYWTMYNYDGLGRTTYSELPDGSITHYSYAGNTVTVTDPAGITKTFTINALGNLVQVQEPDPALGTVYTSYAYDVLNHLTQVSMPRSTNLQTRSFNYVTGTTVGINLLSATNPENGTVNYTYNSDNTLNTKTDANSQVFTYSYDSYKRLTQIMVGVSTVLRTFMYDTNTLDNSFSGNFTKGRLVAVQNAAFTPNGYVGGMGGNGANVPSPMQFVEMYNYTPAGLTYKKRLQVQETFHWYVNGNLETSPQTLNLDATYMYDPGGEGKVLSVNYPTTYNWNSGTSQLVPTTGPTYTYSFDSMYRPTVLMDQNSNTVVNNVSYNAANQFMTFNTETRQYNNLNQMIRLTVTGSQQLDISYNFTAGQNNGKITSQKDNISMETVTYQYDSLNRLILASSTQSWSEAYGYDSFGNLWSKAQTGGAPTLSQMVDSANNHITGQFYDNNGNQTSSPLGSVMYDAENRLAFAPGVQYAYDSRNKRIWRGTTSNGVLSQQVYFYGVDGQKLGTYTITLPTYGAGVVMADGASTTLATYFGSKRVTITSGGVSSTFVADRLGSSGGKFYPYGEARGTTPVDAVGFATYTQDSATGLDYADQRYYASNFGRFMSPDRYKASGKAKDPRSWNRYAYTRGDPANRFDPSGRWDCDPEDDDCDPCPPSEDVGDPGDPGDPCGGGGGGGGGGGDEYPRLNCQVGETIGAGYFENIPDPKTGTKVKTWVTPIWLSYTVTGGDGNYNFFESQYFVSFNLVSVQGGPFKLETFPWGPDGLLNYDVTVTPDSTTTTYGDAPGLGVETAPPNANFLGFSWTAFFTSVSVTSGDGQTVNCPTVEWQNFTTIARKNGKEYGFGTNSVIAVF